MHLTKLYSFVPINSLIAVCNYTQQLTNMQWDNYKIYKYVSICPYYSLSFTTCMYIVMNKSYWSGKEHTVAITFCMHFKRLLHCIISGDKQL